MSMTLQNVRRRLRRFPHGGEPTRIIPGCPDLGREAAVRMETFRERFDDFRRAVILEPRGSEELVGACSWTPMSRLAAGIIFFNAGMLGMCGHGAIGLAVTLAHLGRIEPGRRLIDTPVGTVALELERDGWASVENVPSYRLAKDVTVEVERHGPVTGQVAWGGNWFFLVEEHGLEIAPSNLDQLTAFCKRIRHSLEGAGITGENGAEIDHVELFGPPSSAQADSRNFVLCPGGAYDRSPCGTGTTQDRLLIADGKLAHKALASGKRHRERLRGQRRRGGRSSPPSAVPPTSPVKERSVSGRTTLPQRNPA